MNSDMLRYPIYEEQNAPGLTKMGLLKPDEARVFNLLASKAKEMIRAIEGLPACDERTLAIQKVEEAVMWAMNGMRKN